MEQGGLYLSYTKYFFIHFSFLHLLPGTLFFSPLCFLRCVENFETKVACERCCLWEGLSKYIYVCTGLNIFFLLDYYIYRETFC